MFVILVYDIDRQNGGERRLHKVAKICEKYGVRVQNSVFEMSIDPTMIINLKNELTNVIDKTVDSIRLYKVGNLSKVHIEVLGKKELIEISEQTTLFL